MRCKHLLRDRVTISPQLFGRVGNVPGLQRSDMQSLSRELLELGPFGMGLWPCPASQIGQEPKYVVRGGRHLFIKRQLRIAWEAEQFSKLGAQPQHFLHELRVVPIACYI